MRAFNFTLVLGTAFLLTSCSVTVSPGVLTNEQKASFTSVMESLGQISETVMAFKTPGIRSVGHTAATKAELIAKLQTCDRQYTAKPETLVLSGNSCPVRVEITSQGYSDPDGGNLEFAFKYAAKDEAFKKLSDITSIDLQGDLSYEVRSFLSQYEGQSQWSGTVQSATHGEVRVDSSRRSLVRWNTEGSRETRSNVSTTLKFATFQVTLEADISVQISGFTNSVSQTFKLNGEKITRQEYEHYVAQGIVEAHFPGLSSDNPQNNSK